MTKRKQKKDKGEMGLTDMGFDEAFARFIQTDPDETAQASERVEREDEKVSKYVKERRDSIRRGARRSKHRFRL